MLRKQVFLSPHLPKSFSSGGRHSDYNTGRITETSAKNKSRQICSALGTSSFFRARQRKIKPFADRKNVEKSAQLTSVVQPASLGRHRNAGEFRLVQPWVSSHPITRTVLVGCRRAWFLGPNLNVRVYE